MILLEGSSLGFRSIWGYDWTWTMNITPFVSQKYFFLPALNKMFLASWAARVVRRGVWCLHLSSRSSWPRSVFFTWLQPWNMGLFYRWKNNSACQKRENTLWGCGALTFEALPKLVMMVMIFVFGRLWCRKCARLRKARPAAACCWGLSVV